MRIPTATYRIQLNPRFGFRATRDIIPYLKELGISDIYASPIFKAKHGSEHGYDVVDPSDLNPELGSRSEFEELMDRVRNGGLGWLQDMVPNHMAFDKENAMLMDVLENGRHSEFYRFFDIDWEYRYESLRGKVLAPFLGKLYGEALEDGEIELKYDEHGFTINYYDLAFPLRPDSYVSVLSLRLGEIREAVQGDNNPDYKEISGILDELKELPFGQKPRERSDRIKLIKERLWKLYCGNRRIREVIDETVRMVNGAGGARDRFKLLDELLSHQSFRLAFWKVATEEINYRRFFNINELICLREEEEEVFERTHALLFSLIDEGRITGVRIDHIDGLYDPVAYLSRIAERTGETYIVVEKILDFGEVLPAFWPVHGTTGYDFLNYLNGLFCRKESEPLFTRLYAAFSGLRTSCDDLCADEKKLIMQKHMASDIDNLAHLLKAICARDRYASDITIYGLRSALVEVMAVFPVYRTYITHDVIREADRSFVSSAISRASKANPGFLKELRFLERFLLLRYDEYLSEDEKRQWTDFVMRFQQFTGPLTAKGFEDTTLYVYNRLLSLNEVGGNPAKFGISLEEFHHFNKQRARDWPCSLSGTSTHDTKRGEDVRARIHVLSEMPKQWEENIKNWSKINRKTKKKVNGIIVPDRNDEYFLYQTLVGGFPFDESDVPSFTKRIKRYVIKAVREGKVHTAWLRPDTDYEEAFVAFIEEILRPESDNRFLKSFLPFQRTVARYGLFNSLSQTLLKMTAPGVPDFYQGTELWDLNFVDPDNRRPVDFEMRKHWLRDIVKHETADIAILLDELLKTKEDGRIKLFLIHRVLGARNKHAELFQKGAYIPLAVAGCHRESLVTFARTLGNEWSITIAPRFLTTVMRDGEDPLGDNIWKDTHVVLSDDAPDMWYNVITGERVEADTKIRAGTALNYFPVALLMSDGDE
jgi:(1->4)-alpha-D-glucan 1-alpha-D-glucosylmutase